MLFYNYIKFHDCSNECRERSWLKSPRERVRNKEPRSILKHEDFLNRKKQAYLVVLKNIFAQES